MATTLRCWARSSRSLGQSNSTAGRPRFSKARQSLDLFPQFTPDRHSPHTLTQQLVDNIRAAIVSSRLAAGDPLPSTRKLAESIGVSRAVVVGAYEQLLGENLIISVQGSGTRVAAEAELVQGSYAKRTLNLGPAFVDERSGVPASLSVSKTPVIDLRSGLPFVGSAPPRAWSRSLASAASAPWLPESPDPLGLPQLRAQFAAHTRRYRGLNCAGSDVVVVSGTSEALVLIALALAHTLGRPARIAVEDPGYRAGSAALATAGAVLVPFAVDGAGATAAGLKACHQSTQFDAVMLTPSHQFPLGGSIIAAERERIVSWARRHGVLLIEDDYDSEFRHAGPARPALAASAGPGVAYVASLNKVLSPSLRCGVLVLPEPGPLRDALLQTRAALGSSVSAHTQVALADFIGSGAFARSVARSKREYQHRRACVLADLASHGITALAGDGGLHLVVRMPSHAAAELVVQQLREQRVLVETLAEFSLVQHEAGIVFGYGAETLPRLLKGVRLVASTIIGLP